MLNIFKAANLKWLASQLICAVGEAIQDGWATAVQTHGWSDDPFTVQAGPMGPGSSTRKRKRGDPLLRMRVMDCESTRAGGSHKYVAPNSLVASRVSTFLGINMPQHKQWHESLHLRKYLMASRRCAAGQSNFAITTDKKRFAGKDWCATAAFCVETQLAFWCPPQALSYQMKCTADL
jgi:hypothetical protein